MTIPNTPIAQGAQVIQAPGQQISIPTAAAQPALQQAYQQDPNDPTKWHVVQVAAPTIQPIQVATAGIPTATTIIGNPISTVGQNGITIAGNAVVRREDNNTAAVASSSGVQANSKVTTDANGQPVKTRLRRVACTCPNCKDGDRSRNK